MATRTQKNGWKALAALIALGSLAACALQPTPYQAIGTQDSRYGYSEQKLQSKRFRVQFSGNEATPRAVVQDYLLLRAAELTLRNGDSHFRFLEQAVEEERREEQVFVSAGNGLYSYPLIFGSTLVQGFVSTRYTAIAQFITLPTEPATPDLDTFNAREVVENIGPNVRLPEQTPASAGERPAPADAIAGASAP